MINPREKKKCYEVLPGRGYVTVRLFGQLELADPKPFESEISRLLSLEPQHVVVNCESLSALSKAWVRTLVLLSKKVEETEQQMRLVRVASQFDCFLKAEGVHDILRACPDLREALLELGLLSKRGIDTEFINPFLQATVQVLGVQAQTQAKPGKLFAKTEKGYSGAISGVIGLETDSFNGAVVISFPESTFLNIMSRMLGENQTALTPELEDGASELINIVYGSAKVALNQKGYGIRTALPSVVRGPGEAGPDYSPGVEVVVPFETDVGPFVVEIISSNSRAGEAAAA